MRESDSISPRYQRKHNITIFRRYFRPKIFVRQLQKSSSTIKMIIGVDSPEDIYTARFVTHDETVPKNGSDTSIQVVMRTSGIAAMPRSILRVSISNLNLVFEPHVQTNGKPAPFFITFSDNLWSPLYFFVILHRSYLSNKNKLKRGRLSVCCLVHDKHWVTISHPNT